MDLVPHASAVLVGRDAELTELASLLGVPVSGDPVRDGSAAAGHLGRRSPVLLSGDAGVGKTRMLSELAVLADAAGWRVVVGHCVDLGESTLAYLPFSEVLQHLGTALPSVVAEVVVERPVLSRLQPGGRTLGAEADGQEAGRGELFAAVHRLLEAAAEETPLLVVVEDLHWADRSTRDLLSYLFTRAFAGPVGLVASYRSDDLHRRHPLRRQVAEWSRLVHRVALERLSDEAVRTLVGELVPTRLDDAELAAVIDRAEGNPFFVEELVAAAGGGGRMPSDLAEVLLVRLDRLDPPARAVVQAAAASGRVIRHDMLEAVAAVPHADLDDGVRQAVEMNVVVPDGDGYAFRHALLGEAAYDDLLPAERVRLHQRYVAALRDGVAGGTAAELARHAHLAGDRDTALAASIRAGDEAMRVGGPDEAAHHYERALGLLAERAAPIDDELVDVVIRTCDAMNAAGKAERAVELVVAQLAGLPADAHGLWRARLLASLAEMRLAFVDGSDLLGPTEEAIAALPADAPPGVRARVQAMRSRALSVHDRHSEANVVAHQALEAAEEAGAERLAAEISVNVAFTEDTGSEDSYREGLAAAIDRAERAGALLPELRGRMLLGLSMLNFGELDDAAPVLAGGLARAEEQGVPWAPYAFDCRARLIQVDFMRGRWDEGLALADVVGAPPILRAWLDALRLGIEQARGADVTAPLAGLRAYWTQEFEVLANAAPLEMTEAGRRGDVAGILASYDAAVAAAVPVWGEWFEARVRLAAIAIAELARVLPQLSVGERAAVADHVRRLRDDGRRVEPRDRFGGAWGPEGQAWLSRLEAEERRARWLAGVDPPEHEELVGAWHDSVRAFTEFGHAYELARARIALATVLRAGGDPAGARAAADLAREAAHALGAQPLLDELQAIGSAPVRAERGSEDLTPREQEILVLVAQGRTNGEIGKQLFISTKTVSVHVSNILAKLQAAGRTEAAAIARRRGLLPEG